MNNVVAFARPLPREGTQANLLQTPETVRDAHDYLAIPLFQSKIFSGFLSLVDDCREESPDSNH